MGQDFTIVILAIASWLGSGLITIGYMRAKMAEFSKRQDMQEEDLRALKQTAIPRAEFESRHADLLRQLDRIERKLDLATLRGNDGYSTLGSTR
jgi:hypothetical protein